MISIVTIGGGGGAVQLLVGLREYTRNLSGIVAVTDTGRSTGRARALLNIPAPGDIRNALGTLSEDDTILSQLIQYRLKIPDYEPLDGMAFGNLLLGVITHYTGNFMEAIDLMRSLLHVVPRILPVTTANTDLVAELVDGTIVEGEFQVRGLNKPAIKRVFIKDPQARAYEAAVQAIREADLVVMGPGSLFTTVLACLVFEDLVLAIRDTKVPTVYVCNTTTQPGQTDGYSVSDHVRQIVNYLGEGVLDYTIINTRMPPPELAAVYARDGVYPLVPSPEEIAKVEALGVKVIAREVADVASSKRELYQKQDSILHDTSRVARILMTLALQDTK
jgi:uncharacterized cofD-like protein